MAGSSVLCLAGGSGSGKSTLAENLSVRFPGLVSVLRLDDYQKKKQYVPMSASGRPNYDHPDAVDFPCFLGDLAHLLDGNDLTMHLKDKGATMDAGVGVVASMVIRPLPIIVVEGYLALWPEAARRLYDFSVFLSLSATVRLERRRWAKDPAYVSEILFPMHEAFVEPTKRFADLVVDVSDLTPDEVLARVIEDVPFLAT